ncbi:ribbon-helix-helix protein, CopG family [Candidatus Woesearchaeota archaeon]|nr:ribbon-helix-helix protein, CopG family [Candidatus Woesearchaeota archaeon]
MYKKIVSLNVRLPSEVVSWLDYLVKKGTYKSRSEAIRDQIREYLRERTK